ncbi:MAG: tRNA 2-selenouridine(34) synthase MnmH [Leptothrix sp. (in: b-proteobacteria)]
MSLNRLSAEACIEQLGQFDAVIDARSPSEFAEDHLPAAVNWPVLDDEERRIVGTLHKQASAFEARRVGAAMVARRVADHIDTWLPPVAREWRPLVYCWRGGDRSGTLAWFLDRIGFRTTVVDGGYKAFRGVVRAQLDTLPDRHDWRVLCGKTGSGKTRLLHALTAAGAQVLDLEAIAGHRGSVLGLPPGTEQPSQKQIDTQVWQALRQFDPARPVFVESESKKLGRRWLPEALIDRLRQHGQCTLVDMPDPARLDLLMDDYRFLAEQPEHFCQLLDGLTELRGKVQVHAWQAAIRSGAIREVFAELMAVHYDPGYLRSLSQHYQGFESARALELPDGSAASLAAAAATLMQA